ncbi:hypothetical protein ACS0TY_007458 [Phlomoides rotata]
MFENKWLLEDGYNEMVREVWVERGTGCSMSERLRSCGWEIHSWAYENLGCIPKKIKQASRKLEAQLCSDEIDENSTEIGRLEAELEKLHSQEELHWHQRSRNNWLSLGDRNTSFFHRCASERQARNHIKGIMDYNGRWVEKQKDIESIA